jgi:hypothetical protein
MTISNHIILAIISSFIAFYFFTNGIIAEDSFVTEKKDITQQRIDTLDDCARIIENENAWDVLMDDKLQIDETDPIRKSTDLLGALRDIEHIPLLVKHVGTTTRSIGGLPKGFKDAFVAAALVRIGSPSIKPVLVEYQEPSGFFMGTYPFKFFQELLPIDSALALINDHIKNSKPELTEEQKKRLLYLVHSLDSYRQNKKSGLPPLSDFVLNHPLYKTRQSAIESNLAVLKDQKKIMLLDAKTFSAITKLGELRAVESVETLVPKLLLKPDSSVKSNHEKINEKYNSIKEFPVAITLAEIGIPSIWGLLNEIAANHHDEQYYQTAYQTMTAILPAVAIPGFVNELLKTKQDETFQLRLYKMYPLMGLPIEGTPLIPQLREWQSTDKLFKTTAKFITLEKDDVVLEKQDGKRTTIELKALRKTDQDYVKTLLESEIKNDNKNQKNSK